MKSKNSSIVELLYELKDHRRKQGQRHPLQVVLLIVIMAIMSGAKGERAISRFAKNNQVEIIKKLKISRQEVPSRKTISGIMQKINFEKLGKVFSKWAIQLVPVKKSEWISIDGKAIRGTVTNCSTAQQNFISLITVFASKRKQALAVGRIGTKKESEILKVPKLIEMLDLTGVTFTLDALHCQKKTAAAIINSGNDYLIGVKNNQKRFHQQLKKTPKNRHL